MFDPAFPVEKLRGAEYNPRRIDKGALGALCDSFELLGCAKPLIVTGDGLIVAGHQRSRAARETGRASVPAWVLGAISKSDEIRFNQLHNGTDLDVIDKPVSVPPGSATGSFLDIGPGSISGDLRSTGAGIRAEIARLICRYGLWGAAVASESGEVLSGQQYALACKLLRLPCRTYYVADALAARARAAFIRRYGEFSYEHLPRATWIQTLAQPHRLRAGATLANRSALYDQRVVPSLSDDERILDFGCGQADYVRKLRAEGRKIWGVEFYYRRKAAIDTKAVHRLVDEALTELETGGRFDVVVCDSVINSVDTAQAESDVLLSLSALCRPGGRVYFSGRGAMVLDRVKVGTKSTDIAARGYFTDRDGLTAGYRQGHWFYQKFHTPEQAAELAGRYFDAGGAEVHASKSSPIWQVSTVNRVDHGAESYRAALGREFDLPWPEGRSVGRGAAAVAAWEKARAR